ncbi:MAG: peptidase M22 [Alicyclobacillus sp.]|nr:peptidase M22 [Alicyclobacillus sp.]
MDCVLGIDTSNYTTSLAVLSLTDGNLLADVRQLLPVAEGAKGLRQAEALFHHVRQLPQLMNELMAGVLSRCGTSPCWRAVGVSVRPRPFAASYMPVFSAGQSFAESFSRALGIPCIHTSHQEGHIAAALHFLPSLDGTPFLAVHLSGGTSDVLLARRTSFGFCVESLGEGSDLHAGQFVDRVGVALGLPFPAGPALERLADKACGGRVHLPARVNGSRMSFSGPCSAALRAIDRGEAPEEIAWAVQQAVANAVVKAVANAATEHPEVTAVVIAGGVAANKAIRRRITHRLGVLHPALAVHFAPARYASDNALGVAQIACRMMSGMGHAPTV